MKKTLILVLLSLSWVNLLVADEKSPPPWQEPGYDRLKETPEQQAARMQWWKEARFGMFIHWGVYSVLEGLYDGGSHQAEWIMNKARIPLDEYREVAADKFNPTAYDPEAWAKIAKEAGVKYLVITAKHHDGFALWPSVVADWNVAEATPYGKDLLGPLAEALRAEGLKFGVYYSHYQDWFAPGAGVDWRDHVKPWDPKQEGDFDEYLQEKALPQVRELIERYKPAILWWDTPDPIIDEKRARPFAELLLLHPEVITNNRLTDHRTDRELERAGHTWHLGDHATREQHIGGPDEAYWESCMTMNNSWSYKPSDTNWKSSETLIRNLSKIVSFGGNYLLNVGPAPDGTFPQESIDRLRDIGAWMAVNGEAIYNTTGSPFYHLPYGYATKRIQEEGTILYLHVHYWPSDGHLQIPGLKSEITEASLLSNGARLEQITMEDGVGLRVPVKEPGAPVTVIKIKVAGELEVESNLPAQKADGSLVLPNSVATITRRKGGGIDDGEFPAGLAVDPHKLLMQHNSKMDWDFIIKRPGRYELRAVIGSPDAGNEMVVKINGYGVSPEKFTYRPSQTGGFDKSVTEVIGQVEFSNQNEAQYEIELDPTFKKWNGVNIEKLELVPLD